MKYRLAKELPFAKVGSLVRVTSNGTVFVERDDYEGKAALARLGKKEQLLKDGWIEEVKQPREFYVREDHTISLDSIIKGRWDESKFIKVREVIE
jgi:hypothetical protein